MKHVLIPALAVLVLLSACAGAPQAQLAAAPSPEPGRTAAAPELPATSPPASTEAPAAPASPTAPPATPEAGPAITATAEATALPAEESQSEEAVCPTAQAPVRTDLPGANYVVEDERVAGPWGVRLWRNAASEQQTDNVATISIVGQPQIEISDAASIDPLTGQDLVGNDTPDAVIRTYTGGAHCCFGTLAYDLGAEPVKLLDKPPSNCDGNFTDLDQDGIVEFVTCDDSFAYTYCPFAGSPAVKVIYQYKPGQNYKPASPRFAAEYADDIAQHKALAERTQPGEMGESDGTNKCAVLPLVLDYYYTGQAAAAWEALDTYYKDSDKARFRSEIEATVAKSPFYVSP